MDRSIEVDPITREEKEQIIASLERDLRHVARCDSGGVEIYRAGKIREIRHWRLRLISEHHFAPAGEGANT